MAQTIQVRRLLRDVTNPLSDRRTKNDWRYAPIWKAGSRFVIVVDSESSYAPHGNMIKSGNSFSIRDAAQIGAVLASSDAVDENVLDMLTRLEVTQYHARPFYQHLIESGRITAAEFERAWCEWQTQPDDN